MTPRREHVAASAPDDHDDSGCRAEDAARYDAAGSLSCQRASRLCAARRHYLRARSVSYTSSAQRARELLRALAEHSLRANRARVLTSAARATAYAQRRCAFADISVVSPSAGSAVAVVRR